MLLHHIIVCHIMLYNTIMLSDISRGHDYTYRHRLPVFLPSPASSRSGARSKPCGDACWLAGRPLINWGKQQARTTEDREQRGLKLLGQDKPT